MRSEIQPRSLPHLQQLRLAARQISLEGSRAVDSQTVTNDALQKRGALAHTIEPYVDSKPIYVVTLGKAALGMALTLNEKFGSSIRQGLCISQRKPHPLNRSWQMFGGGHPVPNAQSLSAAKACIELFERADKEQALIIFAVSGGGSAMFECPANPEISLEDLQVANQVLVTCGASIAEVNAVRTAFSAVKGGKLAARAPNARLVTLIISDTNPGDEASVASGPTLVPMNSELSAGEIVSKYDLEQHLPKTILTAINSLSTKVQPHPNATHFVLADNRSAVDAAAAEASHLGFRTVIADEISEQEISDGCAQLLVRLKAEEPPVCLISGGEFSCPVRGEGRGGRNLETVLRCAMELDAEGDHIVILSEATDGVDGNSRVAGAIADNETTARASSLKLDASKFLSNSDSFGFLEALNDTFGQGPTHTNVRDIRILLKTARDCEAGLNFQELFSLP